MIYNVRYINTNKENCQGEKGGTYKATGSIRGRSLPSGLAGIINETFNLLAFFLGNLNKLQQKNNDFGGWYVCWLKQKDIEQIALLDIFMII